MYPATPEGSDVDELEFANGVADDLFYLAFTGQIADKPYIRCARWLDSIPGAGEYFRALCLDEYTEEEKRAALWHGAWVMENAAQKAQSKEPGWQAAQWPKYIRKGTGRVKREWR